MKATLSLAGVLLACACGAAQVRVPSGEQSKSLGQPVFGLGLAAGLVSGFGLSFRHHLASQYSYQIVAGIVKADNRLNTNVGGTLQYDVGRGERTRFYAGGGIGLFYSGDGANELSAPFRAGLGIGVETGTEGSLNLMGELLFTYFSDGTILPLPQAGLHYYFY